MRKDTAPRSKVRKYRVEMSGVALQELIGAGTVVLHTDGGAEVHVTLDQSQFVPDPEFARLVGQHYQRDLTPEEGERYVRGPDVG